MCTAATYKTTDFYFGRTFDYELSYNEEIAVTPRNYPFSFRHLEADEKHYAMIGIAHMEDGCPLYYDAVNEKGLGAAGLNFAGNAYYAKEIPGKTNLAHFEFIPWLLCRCASVKEAKSLLENINITDTAFSDALPPAQLHWIIADEKESVTVEAVKEGLTVYDNPVGVLTNNPPFREQLFNLNNYMLLSAKPPVNLFSDRLSLSAYSRGMGALGLPGDLSSQSRFVRAAFTKLNSLSGSSESESVNQFFHILGSVEQTRGCCDLGNGEYEATIYTSCCNASKGIYYYTTYNNSQITGIDMYKENLDGDTPARFPLISDWQIKMQN